MGHFAIQFAKAKGAWVATTVSEDDVDFARSLGADQVVDYKNERFEDLVKPVEVVLDLISGETQDRSWAVLKEGGTLVSTLSEPSKEKARKRRASGVRFMAQPNAAQLAEIGKLIAEGKVRPHIDAVFDLTEVGKAEARLEKEHVRGKIVLQVSSPL
ncbi:NADP-dependent oxidoreductase [Rhizobium laguerreae]|uniref:NADP-dependent oxidoreductase n=1 Tax=Rhizobium laguerreae TaxID=1076926 RepID=UPI0028A7640C|nr:NADP-dependent oxidoreductase [Rhizobium laguerreae]